jgi:methionine-gamma-lyase
MTNDPAIKMIYLETPSNPALDCIDLSAIAGLAKNHNVLTAVDNSFCSPVIQQPLRHGIDYVIHSTTKYINGHGNGISGIVVGRSIERKKAIWGAMKMVGTNCNPWDAWLTNVGMKTLELRMKAHSNNALALAEFLSSHDRVASVNYLGLPDHQYHDLATRQMRYYGGMMCFEVKGGVEAGVRFMNSQTMGTLAPTMGDVDTLLMHPASMSHRNIDRKVRLAHGIGDGLIRVSVGIEDVNDIIEDFDRTLLSI